MAVAHTAVRTLVDEGMVENSKNMGKLLLDELLKIESPLMKNFRGRGLMLALEIAQADNIKVNSLSLVRHLRNNGVLTLHAKM